MSIKAKIFQAQLGNPLNTHNFIVRIADPGNKLNKIQMLVASTNFPSEKLQEFTMYFQGERVKFPSIPQNSGTWTCTVPEGEFAKVYQAFTSLSHKTYDQKTGQLSFFSVKDKFDIEVLARGLRGDAEGSDVIFGTRLVGCYFLGRTDVALSNASATQTWQWQLEFSFDSIEDLEATPLSV